MRIFKIAVGLVLLSWSGVAAAQVRPMGLPSMPRIVAPQPLTEAKRVERFKALAPSMVAAPAAPSLVIKADTPRVKDAALVMRGTYTVDGFYLERDKEIAGIGATIESGKSYVADFSVWSDAGTSVTFTVVRGNPGETKFTIDVPIIDGHAMALLPPMPGASTTVYVSAPASGTIVVSRMELTRIN